MAKRSTIKNFIKETYLFSNRLWIAIVCIGILLVLLIVRLVYLQIVQRDFYTTMSRENQFNLIPIEPNRGLIYDRNGVALAENVPIFSLEIKPERVQDMNQTLAELQKFINITPDDLQLFEKALKQHRPFESIPLKMKLTDDEVAKFYVEQYHLPGVTINAHLMRSYPLGASMNSVVGYVGRINEDDLKNIDIANYSGSNYMGKMGIEKYFEPQLHGTVGYQQVEITANGRVVRTVKHIPTIPGENLYLTIDSNLQLAAEKAMGDIAGAVVAIQPSTGQVLALVSNPSYDPNQFVNGIRTDDFKKLQEEPGKPLFNRAIRGQFPSGSTIKPFMVIAGLDYGIISPSFTIFDPGWFQLPGVNHVYHDWIPHGHGRVNPFRAIVVSCDTFIWTIGTKMGLNKMTENLRRFGFGKKTGIEMQEEMSGIVPSDAWKRRVHGAPWYEGDTVATSVGQGYFTVTPLQLAEATAIIANRGIHYQPTLLYKVQKPDGTFIEQQPTKEDPVILNDPKTWDLIINAMKAVIDTPEGTAYPIWKDIAYPAAGKTGTAQVFHSGGGKINQMTLPYELRNHSLFIVFAPVQNPQIVIAVVAEHSLTTGKQIALKIMDYYMLTEMHGKYNTNGKFSVGVQASAKPQQPVQNAQLPSPHQEANAYE